MSEYGGRKKDYEIVRKLLFTVKWKIKYLQNYQSFKGFRLSTRYNFAGISTCALWAEDMDTEIQAEPCNSKRMGGASFIDDRIAKLPVLLCLFRYTAVGVVSGGNSWCGDDCPDVYARWRG